MPTFNKRPLESPGLVLWNLSYTKPRTHTLPASSRQTRSRPGPLFSTRYTQESRQKLNTALASVAQLAGHCPVHRKVAGSVLSGHTLGLRARAQEGARRRQRNEGTEQLYEKNEFRKHYAGQHKPDIKRVHAVHSCYIIPSIGSSRTHKTHLQIQKAGHEARDGAGDCKGEWRKFGEVEMSSLLILVVVIRVYIVLKTHGTLKWISLLHVNNTSIKLKKQNHNIDTTTHPSERLKLKGW